MIHRRIVHCMGTPARWAADYLIALLPIYCWSIFAFGAWNTHLQLSVSLMTCIVITLCLELATKRRITYRALLYAFLIGFTLGFLMPPDAPMWYTVTGAILASAGRYIPYVGRYAQKYVHPIALALVVLALLYPQIAPSNASLLLERAGNAQTPLNALMGAQIPEQSLYDLLLGRHGGLVGEVSILMILVGGLYMFLRKIISYEAPLAMLASVALLSFAFPLVGTRTEFMVAQLCSGAVVFTAVYLLSNFCASFNRSSKFIYGALTGVLTFVFRRYIPSFDGVFLALLLATVVMRLVNDWLPAKALVWKNEF